MVADVPPILLERTCGTPLAVQLADGLREAAVRGTLRPGDRLPSTRALATELAISRTVTAAAYEQLLAEGWVHGRVGSGTYVTAPPARTASLALPDRQAPDATAPGGVAPGGVARGGAGPGEVSTGAPSPGGGRAGDGRAGGAPWSGGRAGGAPAGAGSSGRAPSGGRSGGATSGGATGRRGSAGGVSSCDAEVGLSLAPGTPCVAALDPAAWRRAWRAAADPPPDDAPRPDGLPDYRAVVAEHLLRHRGLIASPDDVLATSGSSAAIAELARVLPVGSRVAVEEPGYLRAVTALRAAGLEVVGVPVDEGGMVVDALPTGCAAVYCTPAHQFPLGARLTASRRVALVERARSDGMLIVEDDYDGELRYDVAPLPMLAALAPEVVVHLGTASKILSQTVGAGWLVAPPQVRDALRDLRARTGTRPSPAGQRVFSAFAAHGDLARHLRRLRRELARRRDTIRDVVAGTGWTVTGEAAGAHVVLTPPAGVVEDDVVAAALARGVEVPGLAGYHHAGPPRHRGLVVGYAAHTRAELDTALTALTAALTDHAR